MKKGKNTNKGITLIALVITIIVLLILAGVALATLTGDSGIISNAENAKENTNAENAKEQVQLAVQGALIEGLGTITKTNLEKELENLLGKTNFKTEEIEDGTLRVTVNNYQFKVTNVGKLEEITKITAINLAETTLGISAGNSKQLTVTTTPSSNVESITFTSSDTSVATVDETGNVTVAEDATVGETATITIAGSLSTTVTATCTVTVIYPESAPIGDYVTYNVTYTDRYTDYEFKTTNGWRILDGGTSNGDGTYSNVKLISTGIPVSMLYWGYTEKGYTIPSWWGTKEQVNELYGEEYSQKGYIYDDGGNPNYFMVTGLIKNFKSISFKVGTSSGVSGDQGYFTKVNSTDTGTITGEIFLATGASKVHALTLEELNKARGLEETSKTPTSQKDATTGLFHLENLTEYGYTTDSYDGFNYWLATPSNYNPMVFMRGGTGGVYLMPWANSYMGLRPVVTLSAKIQEKSEGQWEIVE